LPGGPVGPPARWAARSNVEVGQTTYLLTGNGRGEKGARDKVTDRRSWKDEVERGRSTGVLS